MSADPIDLIARAIVAEFPPRSQPDNDDFAEARTYAEAALLAIESAYWLSPKVAPRDKRGHKV